MNAYFVGPGQRVALEVHSDPQCTFIVQLRGRKRWRLWPKRAAMLPVPPQTHENANVRGNRFGHVATAALGRDAAEKLGPPYLDVVLGAGHVLYVPRGVLHQTATPARDERSPNAHARTL